MNKLPPLQAGKLSYSAISPLNCGYLAMFVVLLIWSGFSLTVRTISSSPLTIADVALIRFSVPLILLSPWFFKHFAVIKKVRISDFLFILLGGIPFLFLASLGAKIVPTTYVATILTGTPPLFVAILSMVFYGNDITKKRLLMLSLILIGVLTMVAGLAEQLSAEMITGIGFLLCASLVWSTYTLGLKRAGLSAVTVAIIVSYFSFFIMLFLVLSDTVPSNWGTFSLQEAMPFLLVQGLGVGIVATIGFSYAVSQLGSAQSSIIGSLSPGLTTLLAVPIFDEPLSVAILCGISLTITGVILSNRV
tara:strand:- start:248 stop:1162 length:915 start_codon:yes stop_codon:yes gene_type:complete